MSGGKPINRTNMPRLKAKPIHTASNIILYSIIIYTWRNYFIFSYKTIFQYMVYEYSIYNEDILVYYFIILIQVIIYNL